MGPTEFAPVAIEADWPPLRSIADVEDIERLPIEKRLPFATTYELLRNTVTRYPERDALTVLPDGVHAPGAATLTYRALFEKITQTANFFHGLGVGPEEAVSIILPNIPQHQFAMWGAQAVARANPINPLLDTGMIGGILREANTRIIVTLPPGHPSGLYERVLEACPSGAIVIVVSGRELRDDLLDFDAETAGHRSDKLNFELTTDGDTVASLYHTGGTTGQLKLVTHSHRNEIVNAWQSCCVSAMTYEDVVFNAAPLFHVTGPILLTLAPFAAGAHVIMGAPAGFRATETIKRFWETVATYRISTFWAVPTVYSGLLDVPTDGHDISSLRFGLCGAAPLPTYVISAFLEKTGVPILEGYGMTETCTTTTLNPRDGKRKTGSIGLRAPYQRVRVSILDENGAYVRDAAVGEPGVLLLSGPNITLGYLPESANGHAWPLPTWLDTGDTARIDEEGYLYLTGRKKDLIIRGGHNIDPAMIENALDGHPAVAAVAAVGKPDRYAGELPVAFVVLKPGHSISEADLLGYARDRVAERPAAPANIYFIDRLPQTAIGKIFKPPLRVEAARRAFTELVGYMLGGVDHAIDLLEDPSLGLTVHVTIFGKEDPDLAAELTRELSGFALRHSIHWQERSQPRA